VQADSHVARGQQSRVIVGLQPEQSDAQELPLRLLLLYQALVVLLLWPLACDDNKQSARLQAILEVSLEGILFIKLKRSYQNAEIFIFRP
jgi:hypothetical protein